MTKTKSGNQVSAFADSLEGVLERIVYQNPENGYTVARLLKKSTPDEIVTVTGMLTAVNIGETIRAKGEWTFHKQYGKQFEIFGFDTVRPNDIRGMEKYLGSGLIKWIGPVTAKKIVDHFQAETFEIIEKHPDRLNEIPGLGRKKIAVIKNGWKEEKESKEVMLFLQSHDIGIAQSVKIYNFYGKLALQQLKQNPYQLVYDIRGIGFISADNIAKKLGIEPDSRERIKAGIIYLMNASEEEGHLYLTKEQLVQRAVELLQIAPGDVISCMTELTGLEFITEEDENIFSSQNYQHEKNIAEKLVLLLKKNQVRKLETSALETLIPQVQRALDFMFSEEQSAAIETAVKNPILVLTGGPGTGKTTTVRGIIEVLKHFRQTVFLAAPTGRAAKRLEETTGHPAKTIHRLLEFNPVTGRFTRHEHSPLECDTLIIDESSMIDANLTDQLLSAVALHTRLILVGDVDQLPSVGPGNILRDIIESEMLPVVRLKKIFRQLLDSDIVTNAHKINSGEKLNLSNTEKKNFFFMYETEPEKICNTIVSLTTKRLPEKYRIDPVNDIQILTPMYKGLTGAENLNSLLQNTLCNQGIEIIRGNRVFRLGDKVMQIRNNYTKTIYNGDIGRIKTIDPERQQLTVNFDGRPVPFDFKELDELTLAYAITVHKSQGSEYNVVIMPVTTQHYVMLQRNLLYTAVTRAKKMIILIGTHKAVSIAVSNNIINDRNTMLKKRIAEFMSAGGEI